VSGTHVDISSQFGRSWPVPGCSDGRSPGLLQRSVLRRTRSTRISDPQHPGRILVGYHHHDNGRILRQSAARADREISWRRVRYLRRTHACHTGPHYHRPFQSVLCPQDRSRTKHVIESMLYLNYTLSGRINVRWRQFTVSSCKKGTVSQRSKRNSCTDIFL